MKEIAYKAFAFCDSLTSITIPAKVGSGDKLFGSINNADLSAALAKAVVEALTDHNAVLLSNHGQVVCGKDFDEVHERASFFEFACRIIILTGGEYDVLTPEEIADLEYHVLDKGKDA